MKGNVGGFEHSAEADINELRQKLKGYGSQEAFLKEILQNTDDAGATLQRIAWIPGREESLHPLLRGPALALINDKPLKPSEVRAIRRMGLGTKGATQQAIGKFGQGIKTIFQVCEAFFFLSRNSEIGGNAPDVLWLCNPWRGWHHDEWNRFEEEDAAEILRRTTGLLPEGPWFLLYLPLRRDAHLGSGDQRVQPILESHEGDALECPPSFRDRLVKDLPALLPLLKSVVSVELYERWEGDGGKPNLVVGIAENSERCSFNPDVRRDSELRGSVFIHGAAEQSVPFVGATRWVNVPKLEELANHHLRPRIVGTSEDGATIETREKAYPHAGVAITCRPEAKESGRGQIELRWAVFLPVGGDPLDCIEWPVPLHLSVHLHGYFFLDATRTRVDGQDGSTPFANLEITDERSFCKQWNHILAREGTLPLLPKALQRLCQEQLGDDAAKATQLTDVLRRSTVFRDFRRDITRTHHWALCVRLGRLRWEALTVSQCIIALPPPISGSPAVAMIAFPGLETRNDLGGAVVVIHEAGESPSSVTSLLGASPVAWDIAMLKESFQGLGPDHFKKSPEARSYLLQFLRNLGEATRLELLDGMLRNVRLFACEDAGTGVRQLLSPDEARQKLVAKRLISRESDIQLAKAVAGAIPGEWWRVTDYDVAAVDPLLQALLILDIKVAAGLILECEQLGPLEARHELLRYFQSKGPWLSDNAPERMAARYLLHRTFDRKERTQRLLLQSPESPADWLAIVEYLLDESAEDWRLITDWVDLNLEQRNALGIHLLDREAGEKLLGELGPGTDFSDLPPVRRRFILKECDDRELLRKLPIHELTTGALTSAGENTYLDSEFQFADADDQELWLELSQQSRIVHRLQGDHVLVARQEDVFEGRVVDANGIMRMAILHDEPGRFWRLILACLARVGAPRAEVRELLIDPKRRWLPLQSARLVAAGNVLSVPRADEAIHRLLGEERDGAVSILALDERVRSHAGFSSLKSQILPSFSTALESLGIALASRDGCRTGVIDFASVDELKQLCSALMDFDSVAYPLLPLMRALAEEPDAAEKGLTIFNRDLAGSLASATTLRVLDFLAASHESAPGRASKQPLLVFRRIFRCAVSHGQWADLLALHIRLPNRFGVWKPASELGHNYEGASEDWLVDEEVGNAIPNLEVRTATAGSPPPIGPRDMIPIADYARQLIAVAPEQLVGLLIAVMGGTEELVRVASHCLGGMDPKEIISQIFAPFTEAVRDGLLGKWSGTRFFPEFHAEEEIHAISVAGTPLMIPVRMNNSSLLCGSFANATTDQYPAGLLRIVQLRLLDLRFFGTGSKEEWSERVIETVRIILRGHYSVTEFSGLNRLVDKLEESQDKFDVEVAQRMVVKMGDHLIQILGAQTHASLRNLLGRWQQARQWEAQSEIGTGGPALLNQARTQTLKAEADFVRLFNSDPGVRQTFLAGMRRRIGDFQYFPDSVLFELFQNADDATIEQRTLDGLDPEQHPGQFLVKASETGIRVIAHGRPINRPIVGLQDGPHFGDYARDLVKMLLLNASDKNTGIPGALPLTGRFGLGFKSVHLISDEPVVVSGHISFRVIGGVFPEAVSQANLPRDLVISSDQHDVPATVIFLPLAAGILEKEVVARFSRLCPILAIFAKCVREISVEANDQFQGSWCPDRLSFHPTAEIGETLGIDGRHGTKAVALVLRSGPQSASGVSLLLSLSPAGFKMLPDDVPAIWATSPLEVKGGEVIAINGAFEVDAGRRQLASKSDKNAEILSAASDILGSFLVALAKKTPEEWTAVAQELRLSPDTTRCEFWIRFWKCLPGEPPESSIREVLWHLLFKGQTTGCGQALTQEEILPTQIGGSKRLTKWPDVRRAVTGILDECSDIFEGLWPRESFERNDTISEMRVLRRIRRWLPGLPVEQVKLVRLRDLLATDSGDGPQFQFDPTDGNRNGLILTKSRIQKLEEEFPSLWQSEWKPLAEFLLNARFLGKDGQFRSASSLLCPQASPEEQMRSAFAPDEAILSGDYPKSGIEFFLLCRDELQVGIDALMAWARDAEAQRLGAVLRYLLDGDARIRDQMVKGLGRTWMQAIESTAEFHQLSRAEKERLWAWFNYRIQFEFSEPPELPEQIVRTTPERLLAWWRRRGAEAPAVQLTGDWGRLLFTGLLTSFDAPSVAASLTNSNPQSKEKKHAWFRTLCLCCLLGTRTRREYVRNFLTELIEVGFMDRVLPSVLDDSDQQFESEIRRVLDRVMETPLRGVNAAGEDAAFWRRIFYDVRKMYRAVYVHDLADTLTDVFDTVQEPRGAALFLRNGFLPNQPNFSGVIGQSFNSPIFFLMRELRRLRVIGDNRFDQTCFYVCSPVRQAAIRLGIPGHDSDLGDQDVSFEAHLEWSEAIFRWVSASDVANEYLTECFEMPLCALHELNAYDEL